MWSYTAIGLSAVFNGISDRILFKPYAFEFVGDGWFRNWLLGIDRVVCDISTFWDGWHFFKSLEFGTLIAMIVILLPLSLREWLIIGFGAWFLTWFLHELFLHWIL